jgi:gliding motility-associated-like protein
MKLINFFLSVLFLAAGRIAAQAPVSCGGGSAPAIGCNAACISCNFNGFSGSTTGFPSGPAVGFCGTVENAQWLGFIAGAGTATFTIMPVFCAHGNGVQVALYSDCTMPPLACDKGKAGGGSDAVQINVPLNPGANYFLLIDGYAGDQCTFSVSVSPPEAVYQPPLGQIQQVKGPDKMCPGASMVYSLPAVFGASQYIWNGPAGMLFDSLPSPATIPGDKGRTVRVTMGNTSGTICVQGANTCAQTPACGSSIYVEALDDSHKPVITADTVQHLNCSVKPLEVQVTVGPPSTYSYQWKSDSLGHIVSGDKALNPGVDKTGKYTLHVVDQVIGCASDKIISVEAPVQPSGAQLIKRDIACYGGQNGYLKVGTVTGGSGPFLYSLDDLPFLASPEFRYIEEGQHHLVLQGVNGCEWDTTFAISMPPELIVNLGQDTSIHLGQPIGLWSKSMVNFPGHLAEIQVDPPELNGLACDTCSYTPLNTIRYRITVKDSSGCTASDERIIVVSKVRWVYFPNVFKPDAADGNNVFGVFGGEDVEQIKSLRIFNRWGKEVFEKVNFQPGDLAYGWNGNSNGQKLPPDVFVYTADVVFKDGEIVHYTGDVTLIR